MAFTIDVAIAYLSGSLRSAGGETVLCDVITYKCIKQTLTLHCQVTGNVTVIFMATWPSG